MTQGPHVYLIGGGGQGKARMGVIARVMAPATAALLDGLPSLAGATVVDAGCGGGEVSFVLAERVGATGRVIGFDLDIEKIELARSEAADRGLRNIEFFTADVLEPWPAEGASLVLARFILTHLPRPERMLARAHAALAPGGMIAAQDIDYRGRFCDPPSDAFDRYLDLYVATARYRGGDPHIGARLPRLLEECGFVDVDATLVQPFGSSADVKATVSLTLAGIVDSIVESDLATRDEVERLRRELDEFLARPQTRIALPRVTQAWGRRL